MPTPLLLLVDDAPELGDIVAYLGKRSGVEVVACVDVPSAWTFLQTRRPDLLLVDVNLPVVSGPELVRRVRAEAPLADLPVALFSHWGLPGDIATGLEAGADYVLSKDLVSRPAEWRQRLEEILGDKDSRGGRDRVGLDEGVVAGPVRPDWPEALNLALLTGLARVVGPEVLRVVVRRAFIRARIPPLSDAEVARWMTSDGLIVCCPELTAALDSSALAATAGSLAGQVRRLLGAEASRPFREALARVVPGSPGLVPH